MSRWLLFSFFPGQKHKCLVECGGSFNSGDSSKPVRRSFSLFPGLPFVKWKMKPFLASCCNAGAAESDSARSTVLKGQERAAAPRCTLVCMFLTWKLPSPACISRVDGVDVGPAGDPAPSIISQGYLYITRCRTVPEISG